MYIYELVTLLKEAVADRRKNLARTFRNGGGKGAERNFWNSKWSNTDMFMFIGHKFFSLNIEEKSNYWIMDQTIFEIVQERNMIIWSKNMTFGKCTVEKINDCRIRFSFNFRGCTFCEMGMAWDQSSYNNHEVGFWENCTKYLNSLGMTIFEPFWHKKSIQLETKELHRNKFLAFLSFTKIWIWILRKYSKWPKTHQNYYYFRNLRPSWSKPLKKSEY